MIQRDSRNMESNRITSEGQALVQAEVHKEARHHAKKGNVFLCSSDYITHDNTADVFRGIFWIRNDDPKEEVYIGYFRSCNEVAGKWRLKRDVTALSNSTTIVPSNSNLSKKTPFVGTVEAGSATSAFTDGTLMAQWIQGGPGHSDPDLAGALILGPGDSIGIEFAPFATASANECCVFIEMWQVYENGTS